MYTQFRIAVAALFLAGMPLHLRADAQPSSGEPLRAKEVRMAEAQARTGADHLRLAAWYKSEARQLETKLTEQENLVKYWAQKPGTVDRTKIPNPWWSAQALARVYREKLQNVTRLAAAHQQMAASLQTSVTSN